LAPDRCYDFEKYWKKIMQKIGKKWRFLLKLLQKIEHNIGFEKNAIFYSKNWRKS
jgi:transcription elongation factor GreA-like protein